jgi:CheY-like chemotaxis protein
MVDAGYVLVVEDANPTRHLLAEIVRGFGHRVVEAEDGREAIGLMKRARPALVFLDLEVPEMTGVEVCTWMRGHKETKTTPVVIYTAHAERKHVEACLRAGATDFLTKPITTRAIEARLDKLMGAGA